MKTHRVLNRLSKCANVRYRKNQVLLWFTINSQSKLKKFSILLLTYLPRKTSYERFHDGLFELEIPETFTRAFLLKTII